MMRDYSVNDYGIVLNSNILNVLACAIDKECTEESWNEDMYEYIGEVIDKLDVQCIGEFSGDAIGINDDGTDNYGDSDPYAGDSIYYYPLRYIPGLFGSPYKSIDDAINELKESIGKYLPENYQYRINLRHIIGTYFG